jgi:AraC family transcriptional regulator of adaptative response / methylphosphotriester-DNA alkyltransferase methyltransferase
MVKQSKQEKLTDEQWQAIICNDASYDFQFYYAVKTTGIFCRPSCKSRAPKRENVDLFLTTEQALAANYRPCKRCKPTGERVPDDEWVSLVTAYIDRNYMNHLSLDLLAEISHSSPYHLHRTFKRIKSMTPIEYIQQQRIEHAKERLKISEKNIAEVGHSVGLANTPYFITLFKKKTGFTPASYRQTQTNNLRGASDNE